MPRIIESLSPRKGRPATHDFTPYMDGESRAFIEGEDFTCKPKSFDAQFRAAAKKVGLKVEVRHPSEGVVEVQSYDPAERIAEEAAADVAAVLPEVTGVEDDDAAWSVAE